MYVYPSGKLRDIKYKFCDQFFCPKLFLLLELLEQSLAK